MIYLDHAAATPVLPQALEAMRPYFSDLFFNPSAPYLPAKWARESYQSAKDVIAHSIGAKGVDLVMTSGATESINLAFKARSGKALVLETEHAAVIEAAKQGNYETVKVDKNGIILLNDFRQKLTNEVDFVSISLVNNELGTIQPLAEIAQILREARQNRLKNQIETPLYLHSDASQALSLIDINVARLGVDLLTLNSAKCGGPKGVGALYIARGVKLDPITVGGGQERGLRSGTENVAGTIGFAAAARHAQDHLGGARKKYLVMTKAFRQVLSEWPLEALDDKSTQNDTPKSSQNPKILPKPVFLGSPKHQLANFCPICFPGLDAERLIYRLEQQEIYLSTGAACAASKGQKSHVLAAIGLSDEEIAGSLRISLGSTNNLDQVRHAAEAIRQVALEEYIRLGAKKPGRNYV